MLLPKINVLLMVHRRIGVKALKFRADLSSLFDVIEKVGITKFLELKD